MRDCQIEVPVVIEVGRAEALGLLDVADEERRALENPPSPRPIRICATFVP